MHLRRATTKRLKTWSPQGTWVWLDQFFASSRTGFWCAADSSSE